MRKGRKLNNFPIFFFKSDSHNESKIYSDYIKCQYGADLIHEKSYFKLDLNTENYGIQLIVFIIKDQNQNQCHIWSEENPLLLNAEKISFRFSHQIILINLKRQSSLNEDLFNFLVDNIYFCFFQCLQRLKKKGVYNIELNNILKNMLMQKKGLRHCEKLIKFIFFKSNKVLHCSKKPFIYLSEFQDNLIVYTRDASIATDMRIVFIDSEDTFDKYIFSKQKCFQLEFIELQDYIIYMSNKRLKEEALSTENIRFLFLQELKGKVKSIMFQESPSQESDQLFWFQLDSYSQQLFQVIVALNNCTFSEKFLQNATLCLNINHKDIKNLFKSSQYHSKIPIISSEMYQQAFEILCNSDS